MPDPLFLQGIEEFNCGNFFEAHELWEEWWNETVGEEKRFSQGLVQIAAGYHKLSHAQYNGARKLLERGHRLLGEFPPTYAGVDLSSLLTTIDELTHVLTTSQILTAFPTPTLQLLSLSD